MKKLCEPFCDMGVVPESYDLCRETVRGVIEKNGKLLMVYSSHFGDITFPGGGIEDNETKEETLLRECREEVGAIVHITNEIGYIEEYIKMANGLILKYISYYYQCALESLTELELTELEKSLGFEKKWVDPKEAIDTNLKQLKNREGKTVLERELFVLRLVGGKDEKISHL